VNRRCSCLAVVWLVSVCAACTSVPIRYYTLTPAAPNTPPTTAATLAIDVRVVHTPTQLNRTELMIRTGPTEMTLLENERWASPMKDEIKEAVRLELQRRLGQVSGLPPLQDLTRLSIDIDVQRFEAELGRYALLEASWSANLSGAGRASSGTMMKTCAFRTEQAIRSGYAGIVDGYQRETVALADTIVSTLTTSASGIDASCQGQ
jgi:uncharacterized lipoprotein YmbA